MADRTVMVHLRANVADFQREMTKAVTPLDALVKKSGDASGEASTFMGRMAQSARLQSQEWRTAGASLAVAGGAMTGLMVAVAKTGIEYNVLQQSSRAALKSIMDGSVAANEQMDKLDAFARTSPFAKQVFIEAQQQMLGFGIEAQKVIPYLSAIQDAVAATGGSNQDIAELSRIFSQISSSAKITATDLMQFGTRGVDAAAMIGSQMGMTAAEIRESITAGTLDAGEALDALAAGMEDRFGGAAAGVKDTMVGAFDRVKAAWRDLSATIMGGAVDPDGGGWLVGLTNAAADLLREVEKLPDPLLRAAGGFTAVSGAAALATGSAMVALPKMMELYTAWAGLATTLPRLSTAIGRIGAVGIIAGAALSVLGAILAPTIEYHQRAGKAVDGYTQYLAENTGVIEGNTAAQDENLRKMVARRAQEEGLLDIASELGVKLTDVTDAILGEADAYARVEAASQAHIDKIEEAIRVREEEMDSLANLQGHTDEQAERYANLANEVDALNQEASIATGLQRDLAHAISGEGGRFQEGIDNARELAEKEEQLAEAAASAIDPTEQLAEAVGAVAEELGLAVGMSDEWTGAARAAASGSEEAMEAYLAYVEAMSGASGQFIDLVGAMRDVQQANRDVAQSTADATKSTEDSWEDFYDGVSFTLDAYLAELEKQVEAQRNWQQNMVLLTGRASDELLEHLASLGPEAAPLVQALVDGTDAELAQMEALFGARGQEANDAFAETMHDAADVWAALARVAGSDAVEAARQEVASGRQTLKSVVDAYDLSFQIEANTQPALASAWDAYYRIQRMRPQMTVDVQRNITIRNLGQAPVATGGYMADVAAAYGLAGGGMVPKRFPSGGLVHGPGTTTSDDVPARLSRREFVQRAAAVDYYGVDTMYKLNSMQIPREWLDAARFSQGGFAGSYSAASSAPVRVSASVDSAAIEAGMMRALSRARFQLDGRDVAVTIGLDNLDVRLHAQGRR